MTLTIAQQESLYDAQRTGAAWLKPTPPANPSPMLTSLIAWAEDEIAQEADNRLAATADDAPTMREKIGILFDAGHLPSGDQIFDLVLEDSMAHYAWLRCVDWVLWRQAHGKPVKVLGEPDRTSAAIDARYDAARAFAADIRNYSPASTEQDVALACAGDIIERWERTPEQEAELKEDTDAIIAILEAIDGGE